MLLWGGWEPASYSNTRERTSRSPLPARASRRRDKVCQHRKGTSSHRLCLPTFQHLSTRKELRSRERPQTTRDDCHEEPYEAPPRLQRMLLELQRYDVTIKYQPGRKCNWPMPLATARREPHRKSNWICEETTLPSRSHGLRNWRTARRETPS